MYNSDGYILIDLSNADMSKSNQYMPGLYHRVTKDCLGVNKLALVINAGDLTPMSAVINRSLNYYVITTSLYIFKINSNDILIIEQAGSSSVEVAIVPALLEGTKIADFQVGETIGSLYAPTQQSEINDNVPSDHTTFSSDKINTLLGTKANSADLATVATTGSYNDLSNKPTIPTKVSELQNDSGFVASSSLATVATTGAYSDLSGTPDLTVYQTKTDNNLATTSNTVVGAINELNDKFTYSSNEEIIGKWTDGKTIYRKVLTGTVSNNAVDLSVGEKIDTCVNYSLLVNKNGINFKAPYRMEDGGNYYQIYCFCNNASGSTNSNVYATFASSTADYFNGCAVTCIVEYTKR